MEIKKVTEDDSIIILIIYLQSTGLGVGDNNNNNKIMTICARTVSRVLLISLFVTASL